MFKRYFHFFIFSCIVLLSACQSLEQSSPQVELNGQTMGTYYQIKYIGDEKSEIHRAIDSVLNEVNQSMSTYIEDAIISRFNVDTDTSRYHETDRHFQIVFMESVDVHKRTHGAFDPTVMPLVNYWGFGFTEKLDQITTQDTLAIDSVRQFVGLEKIRYSFDKDGMLLLQKTKPGVMLDFSAIAKGYGVDIVCWLLEDYGIQNYMVEIGGEVRAKGKNQNQQTWRIGIEKPEDEDIHQRELFAILRLENLSMATSGNYRNYREIDGVQIGHTISPFTGLPETTQMLSATIVTDNAMKADAFATATMVMQVYEAKELIKTHPDLEAFFIYLDEKNQVSTFLTEGLEDYLEVLD